MVKRSLDDVISGIIAKRQTQGGNDCQSQEWSQWSTDPITSSTSSTQQPIINSPPELQPPTADSQNKQSKTENQYEIAGVSSNLPVYLVAERLAMTKGTPRVRCFSERDYLAISDMMLITLPLPEFSKEEAHVLRIFRMAIIAAATPAEESGSFISPTIQDQLLATRDRCFVSRDMPRGPAIFHRCLKKVLEVILNGAETADERMKAPHLSALHRLGACELLILLCRCKRPEGDETAAGVAGKPPGVKHRGNPGRAVGRQTHLVMPATKSPQHRQHRHSSLSTCSLCSSRADLLRQSICALGKRLRRSKETGDWDICCLLSDLIRRCIGVADEDDTKRQWFSLAEKPIKCLEEDIGQDKMNSSPFLVRLALTQLMSCINGGSERIQMTLQKCFENYLS